MTNHSITGKQMRSILAMYWSGSLVVMGSYKDTRQDTWMVSILAGILVLPLLWIQTRLIRIYPEKNLFEIIFETFGKIIGTIYSLFFIFFSIYLAAVVVRVFAEFILVLNMPETPQVYTISMILLIAYWSVTNGPENIGRLSKFLWKVVWITVVMTFIIGFKNMNFENLKPVMETELKPLLSSGFTACMLPLGESVICLSLFSSVKKTENIKKIYLIALIEFLIVALTASLRNLLILGPTVSALYYFPSYQAVSVLSIGDFFTRIEVLIGINLVTAGLIKVCVCIHAASLGLTKVLHAANQKSLIAPCVMLVITLAIPLYKNTVEMFNFVPYFVAFAIPFEIILPIILWMTAEIKNRIKTAPAQTNAAGKP